MLPTLCNKLSAINAINNTQKKLYNVDSLERGCLSKDHYKTSIDAIESYLVEIAGNPKEPLYGMNSESPLSLNFPSSGEGCAEMHIVLGLQERGYNIQDIAMADSDYRKVEAASGLRKSLSLWRNAQTGRTTAMLSSNSALTSYALDRAFDGLIIVCIGIHPSDTGLSYDRFDNYNDDQTRYDVMTKLAQKGSATPNVFNTYSGELHIVFNNFKKRSDEIAADFEKRMSAIMSKSNIQKRYKR